MSGKTFRLRRIFKSDGRTVVVALDHGQFQGPICGIMDICDTIKRVVAGRPDAVILNPGVFSKFCDIIPPEIGVILRITGASTNYTPRFDFHRLTTSVEHAVRLGADAVIVMCFIGGMGEAPSLEIVGRVAEECDKLGMPLFVEVIAQGSERLPDVGYIEVGARAAFELGADVLKVYYVGKEAFRMITSSVPIPVLIAGGPKESDTLSLVSDALELGARGVAFGRNVFQAENITEYVQELMSIVHG